MSCRSYGADAYSLLTRRPEKTYARLSTLLGKHDEHPAVALLDQSYFPTKVRTTAERGRSHRPRGEAKALEALLGVALSLFRGRSQQPLLCLSSVSGPRLSRVVALVCVGVVQRQQGRSVDRSRGGVLQPRGARGYGPHPRHRHHQGVWRTPGQGRGTHRTILLHTDRETGTHTTQHTERASRQRRRRRKRLMPLCCLAKLPLMSFCLCVC